MAKDAVLHLDERFELEDIALCPNCRELLPHRSIQEAWVESPAVDGWQVAYRLVPGKTEPMIAEVRVYPEEANTSVHGRWSGKASSIPVGGLSTRVLRSLRLTDPIALFDEFLEAWQNDFGVEHTHEVFARFGLAPPSETVPHRTGRAGRSNAFYARWAAAYVDRIRAGSRHPVKDVAEEPAVWISGFELSTRAQQEATVRSIIHEARRRGLLTAAPKGRSGGDLTRKSVALLRKMGKAAP